MKKNILLFSLLIAFTAHGQWTQEKGKGYYKIGIWWLEADEHYTNTGLVDPNATRGLFITSFFGRYGLNDKITLIGYIPIPGFIKTIKYSVLEILLSLVKNIQV